MRFSPSKFNRLLAPPNGLGQKVEWRRAFSCPCRDKFSGAARQGCAQCHGKGVFWNAPLKAWAGMSGMRVAREWAQFGQWESGDVVLTLPADSPIYAAGEYDRILMSDSSEPFTALLTDEHARQVPTGDALEPTVDNADQLGDGWQDVAYELGYEPASIDRVFWLDPDTQALVDGAIPTATADGVLIWTSPDGCPQTGIQFSVSGRRHQEYYLFKELPQDRAHGGGLALPRRVAARRFDLFGR